MNIKTVHSRVERIEYVLAESDIREMALSKARGSIWRPVPEGCHERIEVEIEHDEDAYGTQVRVTRIFEADEPPLSVGAVDPHVADPGTPTPRV